MFLGQIINRLKISLPRYVAYAIIKILVIVMAFKTNLLKFDQGVTGILISSKNGKGFLSTVRLKKLLKQFSLCFK